MKVVFNCTMQFMMKSVENDIPRMLPTQKCRYSADVPVPDELIPYIGTYIGVDRESCDVGSYGAPKELVKKWRAKVRKELSASGLDQGKKLSDDEVIENAIVIAVEFAIDDLMDDNFVAAMLSDNGINVPADTDKEYYADRFVRIVDWMVAK